MNTLEKEPEINIHETHPSPEEKPLLLDGQALVNDIVCVLVAAEDPADNFYADADTGEFVAFAVKPEFKIEDPISFNWVMNKILDCEANIRAVEMSPEVLKAKTVIANSEGMRKGYYAQLNWLELRFKTELGEYARQQLIGKKEKTFKTFLGSISLRTKKATIKVADTVKALEWAKKYWPGAVKVEESFLISLVPDNARDEMMTALTGSDCEELADYNQAVRDGFVFEPERETVTIKTGLDTALKPA